jgi:flagellar protein FliJ
MMKKFQFRLQRVLETKEVAERECQRLLGEIQQQLTIAENELRVLNEELENERDGQREMIKGTIRAGDFVLRHKYQKDLELRISFKKSEINKIASKVEKARIVLIEASKEKKVLEKLHDRRFEEHKKDTATKQQNILDDIGARSKNGRSQLY